MIINAQITCYTAGIVIYKMGKKDEINIQWEKKKKKED